MLRVCNFSELLRTPLCWGALPCYTAGTGITCSLLLRAGFLGQQRGALLLPGLYAHAASVSLQDAMQLNFDACRINISVSGAGHQRCCIAMSDYIKGVHRVNSCQASYCMFIPAVQDTFVSLSDLVPPLRGLTPAGVHQMALQPLVPVQVDGLRQFYVSLRHGFLTDKNGLLDILRGEHALQKQQSGQQQPI